MTGRNMQHDRGVSCLSCCAAALRPAAVWCSAAALRPAALCLLRPDGQHAHRRKPNQQGGQLERDGLLVAQLLGDDLHECHVQEGACRGSGRGPGEGQGKGEGQGAGKGQGAG